MMTTTLFALSEMSDVARHVLSQELLSGAQPLCVTDRGMTQQEIIGNYGAPCLLLPGRYPAASEDDSNRLWHEQACHEEALVHKVMGIDRSRWFWQSPDPSWDAVRGDRVYISMDMYDYFPWHFKGRIETIGLHTSRLGTSEALDYLLYGEHGLTSAIVGYEGDAEMLVGAGAGFDVTALHPGRRPETRREGAGGMRPGIVIDKRDIHFWLYQPELIPFGAVVMGADERTVELLARAKITNWPLSMRQGIPMCGKIIMRRYDQNVTERFPVIVPTHILEPDHRITTVETWITY